MNNRIDVAAEVQSALPAVLARMRAELADRIAREAQQVAIEEVQKAAREWALAVLVPEVRAQLEAGQAGFVQAAHDTAAALGEAVKDALVTQATENLSRSYNLRALAEKLFS